jgi:nucleoside phosphorylase
VCFAVREEAKYFSSGLPPDVRILLTGIGQRNAEKALRAALTGPRPGLVLSCGFAGGLDPQLATGTVVFAVDSVPGLDSALIAAGAQPGRFHCAPSIATTVQEKRLLREKTRADAVEMESQLICEICREEKIPCATVRVILDTAQEDLPLDFNRLMTSDQQMDYAKLALALVKSPGKVGALLRLQKQTDAAARKLAEVLTRFTSSVGSRT